MYIVSTENMKEMKIFVVLLCLVASIFGHQTDNEDAFSNLQHQVLRLEARLAEVEQEQIVKDAIQSARINLFTDVVEKQQAAILQLQTERKSSITYVA